MIDKKIKQKIENLSEMQVLVEPSDLKTLADLCKGLEEIGQWAAKASHPQVEAAARAGEKLLKAVIFEETPDPKAALETVGGTISGLQAILCNGRSPEEVVFPPELGLGGIEGSARQGGNPGSSRQPDGQTPQLASADQEILADFLSRQGEFVEKMEHLVLALEKSVDPDRLSELKGILHTLKGEAGLLGLRDVESLCHAAENMLTTNNPAGIMESLLQVKDWLGAAFKAYSEGKEPPRLVEGPLTAPSPGRLQDKTDFSQGEATKSNKENFPSAGSAADHRKSASREDSSAIAGDPELLQDFVSEAMEHLEGADLYVLTLETEPGNEEALNAVFRAFHTIKGVAGFLGLDQIRSLAHEAENLLDMARRGELKLEGRAIDVTFDAIDTLKRLVGRVGSPHSSGKPTEEGELITRLLDRIHSVASGRPDGGTEEPLLPKGGKDKKLGEILVESGVTSRESVNAVLAKQQEARERPKLGEQLVRDGKTTAKQVAHALRCQKGQDQEHSALHVKEAVKVDSDRLDRMVDTIGELVIAESMVRKSVEEIARFSPQLARQIAQLGKITRELQTMGMSLRMVPVRSTFQRMARLVRDLAKKAGKPVQFVTSGEDAELDKVVVDRIGDPLVHMLRNAVDHGLEASPEERRRAGKPEKGRIELRAFHKGGNIYIEIEDDGRGLDREAILAKGQQQGLVRKGQQLNDRELFGLIFEPGFSTAEKVTDISGRGVGMDVVKRNVEELRGQVEIRSERGKGTVFTIRLPLTLAIIDGMVARVGKERYIIPTLSIVQLIEPKRGDISTVLEQSEVLSVQGKFVPLLRLSSLYGIPDGKEESCHSLVMIIEEDGRQVGLMVDELLGQQQIVIKNLGSGVGSVPGISGGAIMPDGLVGLILDVGGLIRLASREASGGGRRFRSQIEK
ncbi:MAG: Hpt domain-containing protein [Deltaproteobacteria bacterium]|nr:Hpt domain-containing protein [Deltaproteobacteria bacterium]